jgi:lipoprotein-releasing system permease protein
MSDAAGRSLWEWRVGLRYIRARTSNRFVSFISSISMLGVALGVAVLIVVLSVMNGFEKELRTRILSMTSHGSVIGYENGLENWAEARDRIEANPRVLGAAPFVEGEGLLLHDARSSGVMVRGILPLEEDKVSGISGNMVSGALTDLRPGGYEIVLGSALARELGLAVGDRTVLAISQGVVTPAGLVPRMRRFTVAGIFEAGMYEFDRGFAFVHLEDAAKLFGLGDRVSGLKLSVTDLFEAPDVVREAARSVGGPLYVTDWTRQHANFFRSIQLTKRMMFTILLLVVAVAAFNIVSTLVMVVKGKQGDIAILRTMGATPGAIMRVFIVQGSLIGILGTLGGLALGVLIATNIETLVHGLERLANTQFLAPDVYFMSDLPAEVQPADLAKICGTAIVLSIASTLYPAWRAARTQPAEALRHE